VPASQPAVVRSSSPALENYLSPATGRRDACPTAGKMPALLDPVKSF